MAKTYTYNVISGEKTLDALMHAADLFEGFKRLGDNWSFQTDSQEPEELIPRLKWHLEDSGQTVTAIWCAERPGCHYVDWSVKAVSTGQKWFMLEQYLKQFGITQPAEVVA